MELEEKIKQLEADLSEALDQRDEYGRVANQRTTQLNDMKVKERKIMEEVKKVMAFIGVKASEDFSPMDIDMGKIMSAVMSGKHNLDLTEIIKMVIEYEKTALHVIK